MNRIPLAYQKDIVTIAVTFLFANPVKYTNKLEDTLLFDAFQKVLDKEKSIFLDREIAKKMVDLPNAQNYGGLLMSQTLIMVSILITG